MPEAFEEERADADGTSPGDDDLDPSWHVVGKSFAPVYRAEIDAVGKRRKALRVRAGKGVAPLPDIDWDDSYQPSATLAQVLNELTGSTASWQAEVSSYGVPSGLIGVALSGGGIRSSSFNLGVLQAIDRAGLFPYVDYLSTVSGGGYIGTYLATSIVEEHTERTGSASTEPLEVEDEDTPDNRFPLRHSPGEVESRRFRHLRNHSKFLAPGRKSEILSIPVVLMRGFVINLLVLLPYLLVTGALLGRLMNSEQGFRFGSHIRIEQLMAQVFGYAPDSALATLFGYFPATLLAAGILGSFFLGFPVVETIRRIRLLRGDKPPQTESNRRSIRRRSLAVLRVLLIFVLLAAFVEVQPLILVNADNVGTLLTGLLGVLAAFATVADKILSRLSEFRAQIGLIALGLLVIGSVWTGLVMVTGQIANNTPLFWPAIALSAVLGSFSYLFVDLNITSIHHFYRDHLVAAFVAQAAADDMPSDSNREKTGSENAAGRNARSRDKAPTQETSVPRLSELDVDYLPYTLINATVNVERKEAEYRSGRRASFFFFSPRYCGGIRTKYLSTKHLEEIAETLDVGSAMAISGAAVAPNMGSFDNRFVSFVLALLNVRLNYWLQNPRQISTIFEGSNDAPGAAGRTFRKILAQKRRVGPFYLLREMFQWLSPESAFVNLSDGGHIENLGIYELMRRQCRLIIVGDAECDPTLSFQGLTEAIRLARIDFGYKVEMAGLDEIRSGDQQFAIGTISYSESRFGKLIYLKSNLGGDHNLQCALKGDFYRSSADRDDDYLFDENTYIAYYKSRHPDFPHESTADQFFDEAQFEAYRALGYQVAAAALIKPRIAALNTEDEE